MGTPLIHICGNLVLQISVSISMKTPSEYLQTSEIDKLWLKTHSTKCESFLVT